MRRYLLAFQKDGGEFGRVVEAYSLVEAQWMAHRLGWVCRGEVEGRWTPPCACMTGGSSPEATTAPGRWRAMPGC